MTPDDAMAASFGQPPMSAEPAAPSPTAPVPAKPVSAKPVPAEQVPAKQVPAEPAVTVKPGRTPRDMALSLLVLLVPVLLVALAYRVLHQGDEPVLVDPMPAIAQARAASPFAVATPDGLGAGWRPVSAVFRTADNGATLRLGYLSPSGAGLQVVQSNVPVSELLAAELGDQARAQGTHPVAGRLWQRYAARRSETALILTEPTRTIVVIGDAPLSELQQLAEAMR